MDYLDKQIKKNEIGIQVLSEIAKELKGKW
jgi:hypothetical protein